MVRVDVAVAYLAGDLDGTAHRPAREQHEQLEVLPPVQRHPRQPHLAAAVLDRRRAERRVGEGDRPYRPRSEVDGQPVGVEVVVLPADRHGAVVLDAEEDEGGVGHVRLLVEQPEPRVVPLAHRGVQLDAVPDPLAARHPAFDQEDGEGHAHAEQRGDDGDDVLGADPVHGRHRTDACAVSGAGSRARRPVFAVPSPGAARRG
ncbi:pyoverdine synthetase [Streptomyces laurentii]|uniref:Pyoverdine synthetase n=1 Tax=Streptomyces laurentii TaxID=39478 RepID=A0A160NZE6_STRLU|nr:pyoverdine synthetase [Streptomyces laurentii]